MLQFRLSCCPLMVWLGFICVPPSAAAQITVTVTGIVQSGTDGNPDSRPPGAGNVFGGGSKLDGELFTLTLQVSDSEGKFTSGKCPDGSIYTSTLSGSNTASAPTATLQIGSGSFTYGSYPLLSIDWGTGREARTSCSTNNDINLTWTEKYTGPYEDGSGFGGAVLNVIQLLATGDLHATLLPPQSVAGSPAFQFNIAVTDRTTLANFKYAFGELLPQTVSVQGQPVTNPKTLGTCICLIPPSPNSANPISPPLGSPTNPIPLGTGVIWPAPNYTPIPTHPLGSTPSLVPIFGNVRPGLFAVADPITLGTGNVHETATDYTTAGQNPLAFIRSYNSMASSSGTFASALGTAWRSNFDRFLQINPAMTPTTVIAERPDGQQATFTWNGSIWTTDTDTDLVLTQSASTWTLKDQSDTLETYSADTSGKGTLTSINARNGYTQTLTWSAGALQSVTDSYGRSLTFGYSGNLLTSVTTPDTVTITYGYSAGSTEGHNDRLATVTWPTSPLSTLTYLYENTSSPYALTGIADEDGNRYATWIYDAQGRATSDYLGGSLGANATTVAYNSDGTETVTNTLGVADTYSFTTLQGVPKVTGISRAATLTTAAATRKFTYDANGYMASQTDWNGNLTTYVNDANGQPTIIVEASGTPQTRTTTIRYDSAFRLPVTIITPGLTTDFAYDGSGNLLTKTLRDTLAAVPVIVPPRPRGGVRLQATLPPSSSTFRTWTYTWSNFLLASIRGPRTDLSQVTTFAYDASGALTGITNALGQSIRITAHTGGGLPETIVDPNGVSTNLTYSPRQWLLTNTLSTAAGSLKTSLSYDAAGNLLTTTLPDGSAWTYGHDAAHRLTSVADAFNQSIQITLDALGDPTETDILDSGGVVRRTHAASFDALGREVQAIGGMGQVTRLTFDANGNVSTITDPLGHTVTRTFDSLNRLATSTDPAGGKTAIQYDARDRPLTVTDANGNQTAYLYDGFGDLTQQTSPDTGKTAFQYDSAGNLTQRVDARSAMSTFTYDALDRLLTTAYPGDPSENVSRVYDQAGHGFGVGRLTSVTDQAGSVRYAYDERGNMTTSQRLISNVGSLNTSFGYDSASRVSAITYPSGTSLAYARDRMGRITEVKAQPPGMTSYQTVVSSITYEPFGAVAGLTYGNGITGIYTYDADYRATTRVETGTTPVLNLNYAYFANDSLQAITDGINSLNSQTLGYDANDRLTSAVSGVGGYGTWNWTWDPVGNIKTQVINGATTTFTLKTGSNELQKWVTGATTENVSSTAVGNISTLTVGNTPLASLSYNQANRLSSAAGSSLSATYMYGYDGQRLSKTFPGSNPITFQYGLNGELLAENDLHAGQTADYVYLNGQPIGEINPTSGNLYFMHTDRLGTPQRVTDGMQTVVWNAYYQPFGDNGTGSVSGTLTTQSLRLPGQYFDPETSMNHNGFRDYLAGITRYIQSDPIGLNGGTNMYEYVRGNPLRLTDPRGTNALILVFDIGVSGFLECWQILECRSYEYLLLAKLSESVNQVAECHDQLENILERFFEEALSDIRKWLSDAGVPPAPFSPESPSTPFGPNNTTPVQIICENGCTTLAPPAVPLAGNP